MMQAPPTPSNQPIQIALNRTIRDGTSYASSLTPIPEEWLVERDWHIVHHWEDQFYRNIYADLCRHQEMKHLGASAMISPGTTPQACPVDSIVNTNPWRDYVEEVTVDLLDPCVCGSQLQWIPIRSGINPQIGSTEFKSHL